MLYNYKAEVLKCETDPTLKVGNDEFFRAFVGIDLGFSVWKHKHIYLNRYVEPIQRIQVCITRRPNGYDYIGDILHADISGEFVRRTRNG